MKTLLNIVASAAAAMTTTAWAATAIDIQATDPSGTFGTVDAAQLVAWGFDPSRAVVVDFDFDAGGSAIPNGTALTNQYASLGVTISGAVTSASVFGGPASPPNAAFGSGPIFSFSQAVERVGIVNTSPDQDFFGVSNASAFVAGANDGGNFTVDRFVGFQADPGDIITSFLFDNGSGSLELDNLVFQFEEGDRVIPVPGAAFLMLGGLGFLGRLTRSKR
ncbi:MAG: hypothetical protein AAGG79_03150 [Pseudomonadota bacterium]